MYETHRCLRRGCPALLVGMFAALQAFAADDQPVLQTGLVYGSGGGQKLLLDMARPDGPGPYPGLVVIHGGGWCQGSREQMRPFIMGAAQQGYVAISISYRLMQLGPPPLDPAQVQPRFPAQVHDAKAAVRWLRKNADKYNVNPDRIGAMGMSAGAHLALMLGTTDENSNLEGNSGSPGFSSRVQAVVNMCGPTEMASCFRTSVLRETGECFLGGPPDKLDDWYRQASPVHYVTADDPPVLTIHGERDDVVPVQQAELLDQQLKQSGVPHLLWRVADSGHRLETMDKRRAAMVMIAFLDQHLKIAGDAAPKR